MKVTRSGSSLSIALSGPIGETSPLFPLSLAGIKDVTIDMSATTYINSVGVRAWIQWTGKIPRDVRVRLINCPFVIVSQANMVVGFTTPNMRIDSFKVPFVCESCGFEDLRLVQKGREYDYAAGKGTQPKVNIPENLTCPKCKAKMEPDFLLDKAFKFLSL